MKKGVVLPDNSNTAIGTIIEIDGKIVEDNSWLRKKIISVT